MNTVSDEHRQLAPDRVGCAVLTISDTRTLDDDRGGAAVEDHLRRSGHEVCDRSICPDDRERIRACVEPWVQNDQVDVILLTGGTGISSRDQTYETIRQLLTKELPGYGELFRMLSYREIGPAAMLSRALGGLIQSTVLLTMPGSPAAVELAMQQLILPELGHLVQQSRK